MYKNTTQCSDLDLFNNNGLNKTQAGDTAQGVSPILELWHLHIIVLSVGLINALTASVFVLVRHTAYKDGVSTLMHHHF